MRAVTTVSTRSLHCVAVLCTGLALLACSNSASLTPTKEAPSKSVRRSDTFQAAVSRGELLVAGSNAGAMVVSSDAGKTWIRNELPQPSSIIDMTACPDGELVALDFYRKVWIGDATGKQWAPRPIASPMTPLAITCDQRGQLWAVGSNTTILSSADRGGTWKSFTLGEDAILRTVQFVDDQHGVISGEFGTVLTTQDGGASWQRQPKIPNDFYPYAAYFADPQNGWLAGLAGTMLHTIDGGKTWVQQENRSGASLYALVGRGSELYGLGEGGRVAVLRDALWVPDEKSTATSAFLSAGALVNAESLFVVGAGGALKLLDLSGKRATTPVDKGKQ